MQRISAGRVSSPQSQRSISTQTHGTSPCFCSNKQHVLEGVVGGGNGGGGGMRFLARNEKMLLINEAGWLVAEPRFPSSILSTRVTVMQQPDKLTTADELFVLPPHYLLLPPKTKDTQCLTYMVMSFTVMFSGRELTLLKL